MPKTHAILIREHGDPVAVARCEEVELSPPGTGEVRLRVLFSPINPADVNVLEGKYPVRPALPGVPGVEGVAVIEDVGPQAAGWTPGTHVLVPYGFGAWREAGNARGDQLVAVPAGVSLPQAAMLRVNPATALLMLREFVALQPGEWVLQNAANSAVGRCVIRFARHFGWRTVNVVRRPELIDDLRQEGADVVLVEGESLGRELAAATADRPARLALNGVGGDSAVRLAGALAPGGTIVTYGAMARQPLKIPNGLLIFQDQTWRGFWVTKWYERATAEARAALFAELFSLLQAGIVATPIESVYPLTRIAEALAHAQKSQRSGKVLLQCSASS